MMNTQRTTMEEVSVSGVGLHTGAETRLRVLPAEADSGITFVRTDLAEEPSIKVSVENVVGSDRGTTIGRGEVAVHTVEHFLSACGGLGLDNLKVEMDGPEVPILDGSALPFLELLKRSGIRDLKRPRRLFRVREPVWLEDRDRRIVVLPASVFRISYTIDFPGTSIGCEFLSYDHSEEAYAEEIAPSRSFVSIDEVEALKDSGLIKGGSLENALVYDKEGPINKEPLRYPDEPVRHKISDLIGDLMFLGGGLYGHVIVIKGGHSLNVRMARKLDDLRKKTTAVFHRSMDMANEELDIEAIKRILPHRYPFLLVDRILAIEKGKRIVGLKNITGNEEFFQGHFPQYPIMPGVLMVEAMAQVGGVLLLSVADQPGKLVYFMGIDNAKFRKPVVPGDQIIFEVEPIRIRSRSGSMRGRAYVEGNLVAEADLKFGLMED